MSSHDDLKMHWHSQNMGVWLAKGLFYCVKLQTDALGELIPQRIEQDFFFPISSCSINNAVTCGSAIKEFNFQRQFDNFMADLKHLSPTTKLISCCLSNGFLLTVKGEMAWEKYKAFQLIYDPV